MNCKGINAKGEPCAIDPRLVNEETGYCKAHDPALGSEYMAEIGRRGQAAIQAKGAAKGVTEEELGPLKSLEDAQRWLQIIGAAVAEGRLSDRAGGTVVRSVAEWVKAYESGSAGEMYEEIKSKMSRLQDEAATRGRKVKAIR